MKQKEVHFVGHSLNILDPLAYSADVHGILETYTELATNGMLTIHIRHIP
jgi:hypothetical protein